MMKIKTLAVMVAILFGTMTTVFAAEEGDEMLVRAAAHPSNFQFPPPRNYPALYAYSTELIKWLNTHEEGQEFLAIGYAFPQSMDEFNRGSKPFEKYKLWYGHHCKFLVDIELATKTTRGEVQQELGGELVEARQALFDAESRSASQVMAYEQELDSMREALERQAAEIHRLTIANQALEVDNTILKATVQAPRHASVSRARTVLQPPLTEEERQFRLQSPLKRMAPSAVDDKDIGLE